MLYYIYIIESESSGILYKGFTEDYSKRLNEHNNNESRFTAGKGPWRLIYVECLASKSDALKREKKLKRCNIKYLKWLCTQPSNILIKS